MDKETARVKKEFLNLIEKVEDDVQIGSWDGGHDDGQIFFDELTGLSQDLYEHLQHAVNNTLGYGGWAHGYDLIGKVIYDKNAQGLRLKGKEYIEEYEESGIENFFIELPLPKTTASKIVIRNTLFYDHEDCEGYTGWMDGVQFIKNNGLLLIEENGEDKLFQLGKTRLEEKCNEFDLVAFRAMPIQDEFLIKKDTTSITIEYKVDQRVDPETVEYFLTFDEIFKQ